MKTTLKITGGGRLIVQPMPFGRSVLVAFHDAPDGKMHQILIPVEMAGVFVQAVEVAAAASVERPAVNHGVAVFRCLDGDACKAGQVPCPTRPACGLDEAPGRDMRYLWALGA